MLDRERADFFRTLDSLKLRVQTLITLFVLGLALLISHEMRTASPIINFRVLRDRNLHSRNHHLIIAVVYCSCIALPSLLQSLLGYDASSLGNDDVALRCVVDGRDGDRWHLR